MSSRAYNSPSGRSHPPPARSAFFASSQATRLQNNSSSSPSSSLSSSSSASFAEQQQQAFSQSQQQQFLIPPRPDYVRKTSVSSTSSTSSTSSSSSGSISPSATPKSYSPASLSQQQHIVDSYRNRYAAYLAASWGISPAAAGAEFEHHLHTRPGQNWPHPERH